MSAPRDDGPLGIHHPMLRPLWRRIAILLTSAFWFSFEFYFGNEMMAMFTALLTCWLVYQFFFNLPDDV